jgi:hypothetical protein
MQIPTHVTDPMCARFEKFYVNQQDMRQGRVASILDNLSPYACRHIGPRALQTFGGYSIITLRDTHQPELA